MYVMICKIRVSFLFVEGGGQNEIIWINGGRDKYMYVSVCKACGKLGGFGGMLPVFAQT